MVDLGHPFFVVFLWNMVWHIFFLVAQRLLGNAGVFLFGNSVLRVLHITAFVFQSPTADSEQIA